MCPDDGTQLRRAKNDPLIGKVFADRYEIQSVLGVGGMCIVYKARHRLMNRLVAIKMLHKSLKTDTSALGRFKQEAEAVSSLNHPNIVTVYDFGVTPEAEPFFVMDCLEGETLQEAIERQGRISCQEALPIFMQICSGLEAAHSHGIVHRDLKPGNVLLTKQPDNTYLVKLVDFGIAKMLPQSGREQQQLTRAGEVFGSPACMSPEQCLGQQLDARTDIYALGCLMYETLTGSPPFKGESFLITMNKHVGEEPKAISQVAPEAKVPPQLEELVLRCIAKNPSQRCQTAAAAGEILCQIATTLFGLKKRQDNINLQYTPYSAKRFQPSASLVIAVLAVSLLVVCGTFLAYWTGPSGDQSNTIDTLAWKILMAEAETAVRTHNFPYAESMLVSAESKARTFGDAKLRLEDTLRHKSDLYGKWEGHAEDLEKAHNEIATIQTELLRQELRGQLDLLNQLSQPESSAVRASSLRLRAEAQLPNIASTASKLLGRGLYKETEQLLTRALSVDKTLLGDDSLAVAKLSTILSDSLIALNKYPQVRQLLVDSCQIRKRHLRDNPAEYARALNKLGQFDLDRSYFKAAQTELGEALQVARQLRGSKDILLLCLRSYADLLQQTNRVADSRTLFQQATLIEQNTYNANNNR